MSELVDPISFSDSKVSRCVVVVLKYQGLDSSERDERKGQTSSRREWE